MNDITVLRVGSKMILVNDGDGIIKLNSAHFVSQPSDEDQSSIEKVLCRLSPFGSQIPPQRFKNRNTQPERF